MNYWYSCPIPGAVSTVIILACMVIATLGVASEPDRTSGQTVGPQRTLLLSPGPGNPRNSEGDFITLKDGRILFIYTQFYGGAGDHAPARLVSRFSEDGGLNWSESEQVVVDNQGKGNVMSVSLLRLHDGRIALFYLDKQSTLDSRPVMRLSDDEARTWSDPIAIIPDKHTGYYILNNDRVIQLASGRLVIPVAQHNGYQMQKHGDWTEFGLISCYLSDDQGHTWRRTGQSFFACNDQGKRLVSQEPGIVQLEDGELLMFIRTNGGAQYFSRSKDDGETWSKPVVSALRSPLSPASIKNIPSTDHLLAVWNNHYDPTKRMGGNRTPLNTAVSKDGGRSWSTPKTLFDDPKGWYCYTAIHFVNEHILLGHVAGGPGQGGMGLNVSQITVVPHSWLYE